MKRVIILMLGLSMMLAHQSCNNFDEINTDPNNPAEVTADLLLANILFRGLNVVYSTFNGTDMGSTWAQHISKIQYNDEELYVPRETAIQNYWDVMYTQVCLDAARMSELAAEQGKSNVQAIGLILQAWGFQSLADAFGNVPFSEALKGREGVFTPAYDEEEDVYAGILSLLDQANELLSADGGSISPISDLLYSGDWLKWKRLTNSLKLRALMRIASRDSESAIDVVSQIQEVVTREHIFSSSDAGRMRYLANNPNANPIWETVNFGGRSEFRMCETLIEKLKDLNDPRLSVYAQQNEEGQYVGKPAGIIGVPNEEWNASTVSAIGLLYVGSQQETPPGWGPETPGYIMSTSQLYFLLAEAVVKGYIVGNATEYYNLGIVASFEESNLNSGLASTYYNQVNVNLDLSLNDLDRLNKIYEQKWIALFHSGIEAWTEQRRTGIPLLSPAIDGAINQIPSRYTYPNIESSLNPTNYSAAAASIGGDNLTSPIWWME